MSYDSAGGEYGLQSLLYTGDFLHLGAVYNLKSLTTSSHDKSQNKMKMLVEMIEKVDHLVSIHRMIIISHRHHLIISA